MSYERVREMLDNTAPLLLESIIVDEMLLATLVQHKVLRCDQADDLRGVQKRSTRIADILGLVRTNPRTYHGLCRALQETGQQEAHTLLTAADERIKRERTVRQLENGAACQPASPADKVHKDALVALGLDRLREHYRSQYRQMPSFFSRPKSINMEDNYVQTDLTEVQQGANVLENGITIDEDKIIQRRRSRILVDGKAGSGKTTLAKKYAWQWAEKKGSVFLQQLQLVVLCTVPSVDQHQGVEASIRSCLCEFDPTENLFQHYEANKQDCLVILEAMDEGSEEAQAWVCRFLDVSKQPVLVTSRTDGFTNVSRWDKHFRKNTFTQDQALEYFKKTFPEIQPEVQDLLATETIDEKLLETPYSCQSLGELLIQDKNNADTQYTDGLKLTATLLFTKQIAQLRRYQPHLRDSFFHSLARLALWGTIEEKQSFSSHDLQCFDIEDCTALLSFMTKGMTKGENTFVFQHQLRKDYMAALAVLELDAATRDDFYKVLSSRKKHVGVIRFACGLLNKAGIDMKEDFFRMIGHKKLLGEIEHHQSQDRDLVLRLASQTVHSTLRQYTAGGTHPPQPPALTPEEGGALVGYNTERERFTSGKLSSAEVLSLLDGDNGCSCFSWPTLHLFMNLHLCMEELPVAEKHDFDILKRLIGSGLRKDDPEQGSMYVFPIPKTQRWGQILRTDNTGHQELWILAYNIDDAKRGLRKLPTGFDPHVIGVCIPSSYARSAWGLPRGADLSNLSYICRCFMGRNVRHIKVWVETPLQLKGALQGRLDTVSVSIFQYSTNTHHTWRQFLHYVSALSILQLEVSYAKHDLMKDGYLTALSQLGQEDIKVKELGQEDIKVKELGQEDIKVKELGQEDIKVKELGQQEIKVKELGQQEIKVKEFCVVDGTIRMEDALGYCEKFRCLPFMFRFDRTVICDIESIPDAVSLLNSDMAIAVSLRQSDDLEFTEEECNKALTAMWSSSEPSDDTTALYKRLLEKASCLQCERYELPVCRSTENKDNMEDILEDVLDHFKVLPKQTDQVHVVMYTTLQEVKDTITTVVNSRDANIKWVKTEGQQVFVANLLL